MNEERIRTHKLNNLIQSALLLGGMAALLALLGWLLGGGSGVIWAAVTGIMVLVLSPRASPRLMLRLHGAQALSVAQAPDLYALVETLAARAGLPRLPELYYIPVQTLNAFTLGQRGQAAIALTGGLLRHLSQRELTGVLAHEISHIRSNDIWVMTLADTVSRLTRTFSLFGQLLLFLNLPLILLAGSGLPWLAILLLIFAPAISVLMQLALSRTREFDADVDDPLGLASALHKLDRYQGGLLRRILMPGGRIPDSWILSTHPSSQERIRQLTELAETGPQPIEALALVENPFDFSDERLALRRLPWWYLSRLEQH
jgi:heat shock protein HtpX